MSSISNDLSKFLPFLDYVLNHVQPEHKYKLARIRASIRENDKHCKTHKNSIEEAMLVLHKQLSKSRGYPSKFSKLFAKVTCSDYDEDSNVIFKPNRSDEIILSISEDEDDDVVIISNDNRSANKSCHKMVAAKLTPEPVEEIFERITKTVPNITKPRLFIEIGERSQTPTPPPPPIVPLSPERTTVEVCSLLDDDVQDAFAHNEEIVVPPPPPSLMKISSPKLEQDEDEGPLFSRRRDLSALSSYPKAMEYLKPEIKIEEELISNVVHKIDESTMLNVMEILESLNKPKSQDVTTKPLHIEPTKDDVQLTSDQELTQISVVKDKNLSSSANKCLSNVRPEGQQCSLQKSHQLSSQPSCSEQPQQNFQNSFGQSFQQIPTLVTVPPIQNSQQPEPFSPVGPPPPLPHFSMPPYSSHFVYTSIPPGSTYSSSATPAIRGAAQFNHAFYEGLPVQSSYGHTTFPHPASAVVPNLPPPRFYEPYSQNTVSAAPDAVPLMTEMPQIQAQYGYGSHSLVSTAAVQGPYAHHANSFIPTTPSCRSHERFRTLPEYRTLTPLTGLDKRNKYTYVGPHMQTKVMQQSTSSIHSHGPTNNNEDQYPTQILQRSVSSTSSRSEPEPENKTSTASQTESNMQMETQPTDIIMPPINSPNPNTLELSTKSQAKQQPVPLMSMEGLEDSASSAASNAQSQTTQGPVSLTSIECLEAALSADSMQQSAPNTKSQNIPQAEPSKGQGVDYKRETYTERKRRLLEEEKTIRFAAVKAAKRWAEIEAKIAEEHKNKQQTKCDKEISNNQKGNLFETQHNEKSSPKDSKEPQKNRPSDKMQSSLPKKIIGRRRSSISARKAINEQLRFMSENSEDSETQDETLEKNDSPKKFPFETKKSAPIIPKTRRKTISGHEAINEIRRLRNAAIQGTSADSEAQDGKLHCDGPILKSLPKRRKSALHVCKKLRRTISDCALEELGPITFDGMRSSSIAARKAIAEQANSEDSETEDDRSAITGEAISEDEVCRNFGLTKKSSPKSRKSALKVNEKRRRIISGSSTESFEHTSIDRTWSSDGKMSGSSTEDFNSITINRLRSSGVSAITKQANLSSEKITKAPTTQNSITTNESSVQSETLKSTETTSKYILSKTKSCKVVLTPLLKSEISKFTGAETTVEAESPISLLRKQTQVPTICDYNQHAETAFHQASENSASGKHNRLQTPDVVKNIDRDMTERNCEYCALCLKHCEELTDHYINVHETESYVSRLTWDELNELELQIPFAEETTTKLGKVRQKHYKAECPFCPLTVKTTFPNLRRHYSQHTGEYAYGCRDCGLKKPFRDLIKRHQDLKKRCSSGVQTLYQYPKGETVINMYLCCICHFAQLNEENIFKHLREQHDEPQKDSSHIKQITLAAIENGVIPRVPLSTLTNFMPTLAQPGSNEQVIVSNEPLLEETEIMPRTFIKSEPSIAGSSFIDESFPTPAREGHYNVDLKLGTASLEKDFQSDVDLLSDQQNEIVSENQTLEDTHDAEQLLLETAKTILRNCSAKTGIQPDLLYQCPEEACGGLFSGFSLWLKHMKAHHKSLIVKCLHCYREKIVTELSLEDFEQHFRDHCMKLYFCFHCDVSFHDESDLRDHAATTHVEVPIFRIERIPNNISYTFHIIIDKEHLTDRVQFLIKLIEIFKVRLLCFVWPVAENMQWLESLQLPKPNTIFSSLPCPKMGCGQLFTSFQKLGVHMQSHILDSQKTDYICSYCSPDIAYDWKALLQHTILHSEKLFVCCVCSYIAADKQDLQKHICDKHNERDVPMLRLYRSPEETTVKIIIFFVAGAHTFTTTKQCFCGCVATNMQEKSLASHLHRKHSLKLRHFCAYCDQPLPTLHFIEEHHQLAHANTPSGSELKFKIYCQICVSKERMINVNLMRPLQIRLDDEASDGEFKS